METAFNIWYHLSYPSSKLNFNASPICGYLTTQLLHKSDIWMC